MGLRKFFLKTKNLFHHIKYCKAGEEASISYKPVLPFLPFYNTSMLPYYYEYITWNYYISWTSTIYFENLFGINMAYNLSGHPEPCDPHTLNIYNFIWSHITFLGTLDQCSIYTLIWNMGFWTSATYIWALWTGTRIISANYIWALGSNNFTMNQWKLQSNMDMLTNYIWQSALHHEPMKNTLTTV